MATNGEGAEVTVPDGTEDSNVESSDESSDMEDTDTQADEDILSRIRDLRSSFNKHHEPQPTIDHCSFEADLESDKKSMMQTKTLIQLQSIFKMLKRKEVRAHFMSGHILKTEDPYMLLLSLDAIHAVIFPEWAVSGQEREAEEDTAASHFQLLYHENPDIFKLYSAEMELEDHSYAIWMKALNNIIYSKHWSTVSSNPSTLVKLEPVAKKRIMAPSKGHSVAKPVSELVSAVGGRPSRIRKVEGVGRLPLVRRLGEAPSVVLKRDAEEPDAASPWMEKELKEKVPPGNFGMDITNDWDISKYRTKFEPAEHWELKKEFFLAHKQLIPEHRLACLAQLYVNMQLLGCRYPKAVAIQVRKLAEGLGGSYHNSRKNALQRTFVSASDAAVSKVTRTAPKTTKVVTGDGQSSASSAPQYPARIAFLSSSDVDAAGGGGGGGGGSPKRKLSVTEGETSYSVPQYPGRIAFMSSNDADASGEEGGGGSSKRKLRVTEGETSYSVPLYPGRIAFMSSNDADASGEERGGGSSKRKLSDIQQESENDYDEQRPTFQQPEQFSSGPIKKLMHISVGDHQPLGNRIQRVTDAGLNRIQPPISRRESEEALKDESPKQAGSVKKKITLITFGDDSTGVNTTPIPKKSASFARKVTVEDIRRLWSSPNPLARIILVYRSYMTNFAAGLLTFTFSLNQVQFHVQKDKLAGDFVAFLDGQEVERAWATGLKDGRKLVSSRLLEKLCKICCCMEIRKRHSDTAEVVTIEDEPSSAVPGTAGKKNPSDTISDDNVGKKLLMMMGWKGGGLGKEGSGRVEPIEPEMLGARRGLGFTGPTDEGCSNEFKNKMRSLVRNFVNDVRNNVTDKDELIFSPNFSKEQRAFIHTVAGKYRLKHTSYGSNKDRYLVLKVKKSMHDMFFDVLAQGCDTDDYKVHMPGTYNTTLFNLQD